MKSQARTSFALAVLCCSAAIPAVAQTPVDPSMTFQGQLTDDGQLAQGRYDFQFRLFDAAIGGNPISQTRSMPNVRVENGLYSRELSFVPMPNEELFDGNSRWIAVSVRRAGGDLYTELSPRHKLTPAPYAAYALAGPGGGEGGHWSKTGQNIHNNNSGLVGIGTNTPEALLDLNGEGSQDTLLRLYHPGASTGQILFTSPTGSVGLVGVANNANRRDIRFSDLGLFLVANDSPDTPPATHGIFIGETGRVGMGTYEPLGRLDVVTDESSSYAGSFELSNGSGNGRSALMASLSGSNAGGAAVSASTSGGEATAVRGSVAFQGGTGRAGWFTINNPLNTNPGIEVNHHGRGSAGIFELTRQDAPAAALVARTAGTGMAGYFLQTGGGNAGTAILAQSEGDTGATVWATSSGRANAFYGFNNSTGRAGLFEISNAGSNASTIEARTNGTGVGGRFVIDNASNASWAVEALTPGTGVGVLGHTTGDGVAGYFVNRSQSNSRPALYCRTDGTGLALQADGIARVDVLEIVGADIAEKFPVASPECVTPGTVMEIDPERSGHLRIASTAYSPGVAGVVSGANDLSVGAVLGNLPGHEDAPPIALSGRVWVRCDASTGPIEPNDLLTTSNTPGHAMKAADRDRAYGTIIGKAMSSLREGKGLVLVLVSLQ